MQKFPRRWDKLTCVNFLQRKIIINSIAYYKLSKSPLSDKEYDELSRQLVDLQSQIDVSMTQYGYVFDTFDGGTGFDLYDKLNQHDKEYLFNIAVIGLRVCDKNNIKPKNIKKKGRLI